MLDELHLPTPAGTVALRPASAAAERVIESYQALLHRWLTAGDSRALLAFRGQTVADAAGRPHALLTDLDALRALADAGALVFDWDFGD
jgi:hypothetical protein